jgi:uncharacterized SAM-dependent methyltransferase
MSVFKNTQVAKLFKVSNTTITNWIEAAEKGKVDLELTSIGKRKLIIDNAKNRQVIQRLVEKGKKHIGRSDRIFINPSSDILKVFSENQLSELYANLSSKYEIPYKFSYLGTGADLWDSHYKLSLEDEDARRNQEYKLIIENIESLIFKLRGFKIINIFDIGCGNGYPASVIIEKLILAGFEITYSAIDISGEMIKIAKNYLLDKHANLKFSGHILDIDQVNISNLLLDSKKDKTTTNLILYLGGTLGNQTDTSRVFGNLRDSMSLDDLLLFGNSISEENNKNPALKIDEYHYKRTTWILDILGLSQMYPESVLNTYDVIKREYKRKIPILKNITINFELKNTIHTIDFNEYDEILVYRYKEFKEPELIQEVVETGFMIEQFVTNRNSTYALMLVRPKKHS